MRFCKNKSVWPRLTRVKVILLLFVTLLNTAIAYPAFAMSDSPKEIAPQYQMKDNETNDLPASVLKAVQEDLAKKTNLNAKEFKLTSATRQTWPDGCLGLAKPDELCSQALVDGWKVIVARGKQSWVYRTNDTGSVLRPEV